MNTQDWKAISNKVIQAAPLIGGILGGPAGAIVSTVGGMVANALNVSPVPSEVNKALTSNPEALVRIKELEHLESVNLRQAAFDQHRLEVIDRMNARRTHGAHWMTIVLPLVLLTVVSAITGALIWMAIPEGSRDIIYMITGQLLGFMGAALAYWNGTTRSSSEKTAMLGVK